MAELYRVTGRKEKADAMEKRLAAIKAVK
jgi:hypothetical protein